LLQVADAAQYALGRWRSYSFFIAFFYFVVGFSSPLIPRVSPRAAGDSLIARNAHACAGPTIFAIS